MTGWDLVKMGIAGIVVTFLVISAFYPWFRYWVSEVGTND